VKVVKCQLESLLGSSIKLAFLGYAYYSIISGFYEEAILLRLQAIFGRYRPSYSQYSSVKMSLGVLAYYERRVTSPAALSQLSMSGTRIGEVLLASTYESATYFCLLQVTVQSLESANKNITQGGYLFGRHVLHADNDTKSQEISDPMIIIVETVMSALRHEKISRVPRKDETKDVSTMGGRAGKDFESHRRCC